MHKPQVCLESLHESHGKLLQIILEVLHVCQRLRAEDDRDPRARLVLQTEADQIAEVAKHKPKLHPTEQPSKPSATSPFIAYKATYHPNGSIRIYH